uniref:Integrase catalytic domain-containing protein n=1 Tax=Tanacetum cinerariifolium TaxID=118510 RepID=A0A699GK30_TANCI|nr:hypothetical protein [Tanacetum cinerariifolium]
MHKYEDEEPLAFTFGIGHCRDIDRWHSRREFLKSYNLSSGRSSLKEKMKRSVRKIGLRVYRLTWTWPSVFVLRCYVPLPSIEVKVVRQDHMHGEHDVFLERLSHGYLHRRQNAAPRGERTGGRTGRGGGRTREPTGRVGGRTGDQNVQGVDRGNQASNIQGDVRSVNVNNGRNGYSYKKFMTCNPKDYDGKGGAIDYTRWIEKMESEDFKVWMRKELCPNNEMQKLKTEFWCHAMVGAVHVAYTDQFHELARLVPHLVTPENKMIERNGSLRKNIKKIGNDKELSRDGNVRDDNKRSRIGRMFATTTNPMRKEYIGTHPSVQTATFTITSRCLVVSVRTAREACFDCAGTDHYKAAYPRLNRAPRQRGNHQNQAMTIEGCQGHGKNDIEPSDLDFSYEIEIASGQLVEINKVIQDCKLEIEGYTFDIDLIPFGHKSFDVIVGMDWLSRHKAEIVCHEKVGVESFDFAILFVNLLSHICLRAIIRLIQHHSLSQITTQPQVVNQTLKVRSISSGGPWEKSIHVRIAEGYLFHKQEQRCHEHVERVLDIVSLFNIFGVSHDAVVLRVFPITLIGVAKRWVDRLPPGTVDSWDLFKKPLSIGHKNVSEPVKKALLKTWLLDRFREELVKDPQSRSFDDYKWMFDLEVDQLADEYELGIGKKGHMLDDIWENCRKVQGDNTYYWHDQKSKEEERRELIINLEEYDLPMVHVETLELKSYSFDSGENFICVTKELMDALPLGRKNGLRFRDMIRKEAPFEGVIEKLYAKFSKLDFRLQEVQFLRHVINGDIIHVDPSKIEAVKKPLELHPKFKNNTYDWGEKHEEAFQILKDKLCNAHVLALSDGSEDSVVYCDASGLGLGCVLMQRGKKELNMRQRRWIELFSEYDCEICYHPGKANVVADALSRKERIKPKGVRATNMTIQSSIKDRILAAQNKASEVVNAPVERLQGLDEQMKRRSDGAWYYQDQIWVSLTGDVRTLIMNEAHKSKYSVHPEADKMYWWLGMKKDIALYWWLGMKKDIALYINYKMDRLARLYLNEIVARPGVPISIVSDRDSRFTSRFWQSMHKALGTRLDMSTVYHVQTDGPSERTIQTLEDMLRACVMDFGGSWDVHLPLVEFSYNNSYHSSVRCAPFEALYGRKCRSPILWAEVG